MSKNIKLSNGIYLDNTSLSLPVAASYTGWGDTLTIKGCFPHIILLIRENIYSLWLSGNGNPTIGNKITNIVTGKYFTNTLSSFIIEDTGSGGYPLKFSVSRENAPGSKDFTIVITYLGTESTKATITAVYVPA